MEKKEKSINVEGIVLNEQSIEALQYFQEDNNDGIKAAIETLTAAADMIVDLRSSIDVDDDKLIQMLSSIKYLRSHILDLKA